MTDFELTLSQAKLANKPVLLTFSGSDWCIWCVRLEREVFSQLEFQNWAKENVVTFTADFPQKTALPEEVQKQNDELALRYRIDSFPTVLLLNPQGVEIARTGYRQGGAAAYIEHLKQLLK